MAWHAATRGMTSLSFCQGTGKPKSIGFLETFRHPIYQKKKIITAGIILSLKLKEQKYKFVELLILTLNKFISYQFLLTLLKRAKHEQSSPNN